MEDALKEAAEPPHRWAYFANYNGIMKSYPSTKVDCGNYDPRYRPWYVAATSGRKNVIVIMDVSGSMGEGNPSRISLAKEAASSVINTLGPADTAAVITFATHADSVHFSKIVQATTYNKNRLLEKIDYISANGATDYEKAFRKAFEMLEQANKDEFGAILCDETVNVFLFLTDGKPSGSNTTT